MTAYTVKIPMTGYIIVPVEAENRDDAISKAWDADWRLKIESDDGVELGEIETHSAVTRGNVCGAVLNEIEVDED